jgi:hypothetical protein
MVTIDMVAIDMVAIDIVAIVVPINQNLQKYISWCGTVTFKSLLF